MSDFYWEDEGGYEADCDYLAEVLDEMLDEYTDLLDMFPYFEQCDANTCLELINMYNQKKQKREKQRVITNDRTRREKELQGKYLIVCEGYKSGKTVYLQDRNISKGGFWTQFKSNALGFDTRQGAEKIASTFRHNNPKVVWVCSDKTDRDEITEKLIEAKMEYYPEPKSK